MTNAKSKSKVNSDEKFERQDFDLFHAIEQIDRKNYDYYDSLSEEQRKKFVPYMMTHWISAVKGKSELSSYYLMSANIAANKHLFNEQVQNHPELQWLMMCAASPGMGKQFHQWIPHLNPKISALKDSAKQKEIADYFSKIYKSASTDDINLIATELTTSLNHKHKLASIHKNLKLEDIEVLAGLVTEQDIKNYEDIAGNS